jgi:putative transposase
MVGKLKRKQNLPIELSCQTLEVSRSGYYAWVSRPESERDTENRTLIEQLRKIHAESDGTYGAPRAQAQLSEDGKVVSKNRVARLMKKAGIAGIAKQRYRVKTTDSDHPLPIAERIFQTEEPETWPTRPNAVWASDITYVPTDEGWLYLAIFLDVFTRKVVGHAMDLHLRTNLVTRALDMALGRQIGVSGKQNSLVGHSDRGCQYASEEYRERLKAAGITASMSRRANCYDNAYAESFFHTLKVELVHRRRFRTRDEARAAIFKYIEAWYNRKRLHSALGYVSPVRYEQAAHAA